jgi:hypothetical protein
MIRTEVGRGYRFTGTLRSDASPESHECPARSKPRLAPLLSSPAVLGSSPGAA